MNLKIIIFKIWHHLIQLIFKGGEEATSPLTQQADISRLIISASFVRFNEVVPPHGTNPVPLHFLQIVNFKLNPKSNSFFVSVTRPLPKHSVQILPEFSAN